VDDLIKTITEKFNIDADKARGIVDTVVDFMKDKLPGPLADQVAGFLDGDDDGDDDDGGGLMDSAKGLLGG
jgi:hypothetical protein